MTDVARACAWLWWGRRHARRALGCPVDGGPCEACDAHAREFISSHASFLSASALAFRALVGLVVARELLRLLPDG